MSTRVVRYQALCSDSRLLLYQTLPRAPGSPHCLILQTTCRTQAERENSPVSEPREASESSLALRRPDKSDFVIPRGSQH